MKTATERGRRAAISLALMLAIAGCGQSGPLVLPQDLPEESGPAADPDREEDTQDDE